MDQEIRTQYMNLYKKDSSVVFHAMKYFRQLLSRTVADVNSNTLDPAIKGSLVPRFVELLGHYGQPHLQVEAAWALTNLACGSNLETWMLVAVGAAEKLLELLTSSANPDVRDQAVWAISNIAGDSHQCREYLLGIGALEACIAEMRRCRHHRFVPNAKALESRRNLVWTLSNLCRTRSTSSYPWPKFAPVVHVITLLFSVPSNLSDDELVAESCWTLAYLMDGNNNWAPVQSVIVADLVPQLVGLLTANHQNPNRVLSAVVRAVGNIVTGTAEQTQTVLDAGILGRLSVLMELNNDSLMRELCWMISNITAGTEQQIGMVINRSDIFGNLIMMASGHRSLQVRREAAWAVCNALSGGNWEQKYAMINMGCIKALCASVNTCEDQRLMETLLNSIEIIACDQQASTFGRNNYALMIEEFGIVNQLKRISKDERWSANIRTHCTALLDDIFKNEQEQDDEEPIVIHFNRKCKTDKF